MKVTYPQAEAIVRRMHQELGVPGNPVTEAVEVAAVLGMLAVMQVMGWRIAPPLEEVT